MDEVARGESFVIKYEAESVRPASVIFFYDSDKNPANGRTRITTIDGGASGMLAPSTMEQTTSTLSPTDSHAERTVYLPLTMNQYLNCDDCVRWSTEDVAPGRYFICAEIDDGYNSTYRCSDSPVLVR